jgi:hypothetical protein
VSATNGSVPLSRAVVAKALAARQSLTLVGALTGAHARGWTCVWYTLPATRVTTRVALRVSPAQRSSSGPGLEADVPTPAVPPLTRPPLPR